MTRLVISAMGLLKLSLAWLLVSLASSILFSCAKGEHSGKEAQKILSEDLGLGIRLLMWQEEVVTKLGKPAFNGHYGEGIVAFGYDLPIDGNQNNGTEGDNISLVFQDGQLVSVILQFSTDFEAKSIRLQGQPIKAVTPQQVSEAFKGGKWSSYGQKQHNTTFRTEITALEEQRSGTQALNSAGISRVGFAITFSNNRPVAIAIWVKKKQKHRTDGQ